METMNRREDIAQQTAGEVESEKKIHIYFKVEDMIVCL